MYIYIYIYIYKVCYWSNKRKLNILQWICQQRLSNLIFRLLLFHILVLYTCLGRYIFRKFKWLSWILAVLFIAKIVLIGCFDFVQFQICYCKYPIEVNYLWRPLVYVNAFFLYICIYSLYVCMCVCVCVCTHIHVCMYLSTSPHR